MTSYAPGPNRFDSHTVEDCSMKQPSACKGIGIKNPSSGFSIPTPYTPKPNRFTSHTLLGLFLKATPLRLMD